MDQVLPLTLRYRPRTFADMVGQRAARVTLTQMIRTGRVPPAVLLWGSWGSGKTTASRVVASALNCEADSPEARPCGKCPTCESIVDGKSTDVIEIDAASAGLAEDMRELRQQVRFQPLGRYRVVVLDEAHELSVRGQQTLLKVLEEPPPRVVFLLATTNADRLLPTIASRCFSVRFHRISLTDIAGRLRYISEREGFPCSEELALSIADRSQGALRDAVMLLDQCMLVGITAPEQLSQLLGDSDVALRIVEALASGDLPRAFAAAREGLESVPSPSDLVGQLVGSLRRLMVLTSLESSRDAGLLSPPATVAELALAPSLAAPRLVAALTSVWEYYRSIAPASDPFAAMDLLIVVLSKSLSPAVGNPVKTSSVQTPSPNTPRGTGSPAVSVDDVLAMVRPATS